MFIQFILTIIAVFAGNFIFQIFKEWVTQPREIFGFIKPERTVWHDLREYCKIVNDQLDKSFKASHLPIDINFPQVSNTWTRHDEAKEIVSGLLQNVGWVVIPTDNLNVIRLDAPRVISPKQTEPA